MENREAKRSKKRPIKPSSDSIPSEPGSNVEITHSKKKKRQTTKHRIQDDDAADTTKEGEGVAALKLGVCVVPAAKKFLLLLSFLKNDLSKKVVVVCSSWQATKFYTDLLKHMQFDVVYFHGKMDMEKKGSSASKFTEAQNGGILFTDIPVESLQVSHVEVLRRSVEWLEGADVLHFSFEVINVVLKLLMLFWIH